MVAGRIYGNVLTLPSGEVEVQKARTQPKTNTPEG